MGAGLGAAVVALLGADVAQAQTGDFFARDRGVSVKQRPKPEYEALGARSGSWMFYPKVQSDFSYDSNILAVETDEVSDAIISLAPQVEVESDWARHSVTGFARARATRYADRESENFESYGLGAAGRFDIQRGRNVSGDLSFVREVEPRTASNTPASIAEPIEFDRLGGSLGSTWTLNRLRFTSNAGFQTYDYKDGVSISGVVVPQDTRDQTTYTLSLRADYAISPATAVFFQVEGNERRFDNGDLLTPLRNSDGISLLAGANFEISSLVRGDIGLGYLSQSFDNGLYGKIDGFNGRARLEYFATPLLTLGLNANRSVVDSGIIGSAGILTTRMEASADYELLRNVIIEGRLGALVEEFDTLDRQNDTYYIRARATYLLNRAVGVTGSYGFETRDSTGVAAFNDFDAHRVMLSLVLQY